MLEPHDVVFPYFLDLHNSPTWKYVSAFSIPLSVSITELAFSSTVKSVSFIKDLAK